MTGAAVGTAAYMSPEQATGAKVDARTDLFSFGSVLYEMATGRRAFPGDNTGTVIMRLLKGEFIPPRSLNPAIPERLETIILRAMEVDPNRRYQSATGMLEDLRSLSRVLAPDVSSTAIDMPIAPAAVPARRDSRTRGWIIGVAGIVLIARGRRLALDPNGSGDRAHEQGQHPRRWFRQHHGRCRVRRDDRDGAEGSARPVSLPGHRP